MNKLAREDMGRERAAAMRRAIRQGLPVEDSDRDLTLDDAMDRLRRID